MRLTLLLILLNLAGQEVAAATAYHVRLTPSNTGGLAGRVALDLTSSDEVENTVTIHDFAHDGTAQSVVFEGGPVSGDLLFGSNPAASTTIEDQYFFNEIGVPFQAFGGQITFSVELTENPPALLGPPDEASFYMLRSSDLTAYPTSDDLGTGALFVIDVTGQAGGDLGVFSPMTFVAPDSLILDGAVLSVPSGRRSAGRLRFRSVIPNPSPGAMVLTYEVPDPGGRVIVKVFDVAGRLVAEPFKGRRAAGTWATRWDASDSGGRAVAAGVYIVQLQMAGQSLVRRVVLTR